MNTEVSQMLALNKQIRRKLYYLTSELWKLNKEFKDEIKVMAILS